MGYVTREEFDRLQEHVAQRQRDELVQAAIDAGKITPGMKEWADAYALKDPGGFAEFTSKAPMVTTKGAVLGDELDTLSVREREFFCLIAEEKSIKKVAEQLFIMYVVKRLWTNPLTS